MHGTIDKLDMKEIPGWPGYFVSPSGKVFSRRRGSLRPLRSRISRRYAKVRLCAGGIKRFIGVHRLVAMAYLPLPAVSDRPVPPLVRHLDNNPLNNDVSNLAWGTYEQNMADRITHGTASLGVGRNRLVKLSAAQVVEIRRRRRDGETCAAIAASVGCVTSYVSRICAGTRWASLKDGIVGL